MDGVRARQPVARNTGCSRNPHLRGRWPRAGTHWAQQLRGGHAARSGAPCAAGLSRVCLLGIRCVRDAWLRMNEKKKKDDFSDAVLGRNQCPDDPESPHWRRCRGGTCPSPAHSAVWQEIPATVRPPPCPDSLPLWHRRGLQLFSPPEQSHVCNTHRILQEPSPSFFCPKIFFPQEAGWYRSQTPPSC